MVPDTSSVYFKMDNTLKSSTSAVQDVFKLPAQPHTNSRLIQLPPELCSKILHLLMKHHSYIPTLQESSNGSDWRPDWSSFSSQILRVCQLLYVEGKDVLYRKNTLGVLFACGKYHTDLRSEYFVYVLNEQVGLDDCLTFCERTLLCNHSGPSIWEYAMPPRITTSIFSWLNRFERLHITFMCEGTYMLASRLLKKVVTGKHVTIQLYPSCGAIIESLEYLDPLQNNSLLASFECYFNIWDFESIKYPRTGCSIDSSSAQNAMQTIYRRAPDHDLVPEMINLEDTLVSLPRGLCTQRFSGRGYDEEQSLLWDAVRKNDVASFKSIRKAVLERMKSSILNDQENLQALIEKKAQNPYQREIYWEDCVRYRTTYSDQIEVNKCNRPKFKLQVFRYMSKRVDQILTMNDHLSFKTSNGSYMHLDMSLPMAEVVGLTDTIPGQRFYTGSRQPTVLDEDFEEEI